MFCKISPPAGAKMNDECFHLPLTTQFNCECENFQHNANVLMTGPTEFIHEQLARLPSQYYSKWVAKCNEIKVTQYNGWL